MSMLDRLPTDTAKSPERLQPEEEILSEEELEEARMLMERRKRNAEAAQRRREEERAACQSDVSREYFSSGASIELPGLENFNETLREQVQDMEEMYARQYEDAANEHGVSVEEFKSVLQAKVIEMVRASNFFCAVDADTVETIMNVDGRLKSQFETGTSKAVLNPGFRSKREAELFGITDDASENPSMRPIYGYFTDGTNGEINDTGTIPPESALSSYGKVNFKLKRARALAKSTITFADSILYEDIQPSPAMRPHFSSFPADRAQHIDRVERTSKTEWTSSYTEAQYHGGVTMDDLESIHISAKNGMGEAEMNAVRQAYDRYMLAHPESQLTLVEY